MGELDNQNLYYFLIAIIGILSIISRIIYYYLVFCSPYVLRSYSHLVENESIIEDFLANRTNYTSSVLILFYVLTFFYFFASIYFFHKVFWGILLLFSAFFVLFLLIDSFVKDVIFIGINRYLKYFDSVMMFVKFLRFLFPLASVFNYLSGFLLRFWEQDIDVNKKYFSEAIVYLDDFNWDDYRVEIVEKFLAMNDTLVREIMVPRVDIVALEANKTISEVAVLIMKYGYSKYPVFEDSIDNIIGVVFLKDMLRYIFTNQGFIRLKDIARIPLIVPESKNIYELLNIMKQNRSSIAVVVDEYGGTSGIVTVSDLLQELLGKIQDEHDKESEEENIQKLSSSEYVVNPKIDIYTLEEYLGFDFPDKEDREYTTLSGLIYTKLGRIPQEGETINIDNIILKILEIKKNKINKVLIKLD
ncbi:MAG: hemolysin family protein [Candidatus Calescibacterium sp.]|nr:hemolysin family protein [Candidatus Calescibacterium sp.]MDW8132524.1 hemolysin family protein [Candidatus Calescibacterium sp.]